MRAKDIIDAELTTLYEKVKRLTDDREKAMRLAERTNELLQEMKTEKENYRNLWEEAANRLTRLEAARQNRWLSWFKS
jgi:chromosome segregation ATPase